MAFGRSPAARVRLRRVIVSLHGTRPIPRRQMGTCETPSQLGMSPDQLSAIFFTHMHTDHSEGFADILQLRWHFYSTGPKADVVCSSDVASPLGFSISCRKFVMHIAAAFIQSGEIARRLSEVKERVAGWPADLTKITTRSEERRVGKECRYKS